MVNKLCPIHKQESLGQFTSLIILGGGCESEGEIIEVVEFSIPEVKNYMRARDVHSPASFFFGISWFLLNKSEYCS